MLKADSQLQKLMNDVVPIIFFSNTNLLALIDNCQQKPAEEITNCNDLIIFFMNSVKVILS